MVLVDLHPLVWSIYQMIEPLVDFNFGATQFTFYFAFYKVIELFKYYKQYRGPTLESHLVIGCHTLE